MARRFLKSLSDSDSWHGVLSDDRQSAPKLASFSRSNFFPALFPDRIPWASEPKRLRESTRARTSIGSAGPAATPDEEPAVSTSRRHASASSASSAPWSGRPSDKPSSLSSPSVSKVRSGMSSSSLSSPGAPTEAAAGRCGAMGCGVARRATRGQSAAPTANS
jgi:hypothetical protein